MIIGNKSYKVSTTNTTESFLKGMMFEESLDDDRGMLFVFKEEDYHGMWMKNTKIPLDCIWVNESGKIVDVQTLSPFNTNTIYPKAKAKYVIELNEGEFDGEIGDYITEATALMNLINKHDDPFSFLAAAMDAIADGTLKLKTRGLANARELVAAWNKSKKRKIKLKEAVDYLTEANKGFVKGWIHKSGTIMDTTIYDRYHIMQVSTNLRKFGLDKNKMLKIISDVYPDSPEEWAEQHLDNLQTGKVDNDKYIEEYLQKKGWCMFVIDKTHGSISGYDERSTKKSAKALDDKYLPYETRKDLKLFEVKLVKGRPKYITSKFDWYNWLEGKAERKYVSKMAQFRDEKEIDMKSFKEYISEGGKHKNTYKARAVAKVEAEWIKKKEKLDDEIDDIEDKIEKLKSRGPSDKVKKAKSVVDRLRKLKDAATKRKLDAQKKIDIATAKIEALRKKLK